MRGRWHGGAVTDEVGALASSQRCPPHQSPSATASPHRGSLWDAQNQSLLWEGRWLGEAETERSYQICSNLSVSLRLPAPLQGEPLARCGGGHPSGHSGQRPLTRGSLGACKFIKPPRKKVQSDKLRLHLLFAANIQRQRLIKLIPTYQAARTKTPVR